MHRQTFLEVNLNNILLNFFLLKNICKSKFYPVVKANAYGLGMIPVAKILMKKAKINQFAVSLIEEAIQLKILNNNLEILLLNAFIEKNIKVILDYDLMPSLMDYSRAKILNEMAYKKNKLINVQIKVDTGMNRLGVKNKKAIKLIKEIINMKNLKIKGIFSHLSTADELDNNFAKEQINSFLSLKKECINLNLKTEFHLANSAALIRFSESHLDAVRSGIMLYGSYPSKEFKSKFKSLITLKKVLKLKSQIICIKSLKKGEGISYGQTFKSNKMMSIGVVAIGYADGYSTLLSNLAEVYIKGKRTKVLGRVCMDYIMIDLTNINNVKLEDEVILIGDGITEEELSEKSTLIPYEIMTSISNRVPRIYLLK